MKNKLFTLMAAFIIALAVITAGCTDTTPSQTISTPRSGLATAPVGEYVSVPYGEEVAISLDAPATTEVYLTMNARADAKELSGGRSFMRIKVNGKDVLAERLVNKNLNFTYGDGFKTSYYSTNMSAWYLFFSPDFVGYDNPKVYDHILEGNAYAYKFDVSDIVNRGAPNEIAIENIGDEVAAQYTDPKDIEFYKSASIIASPVRLSGRGADVVQVTKTASPVRLIPGKTSVVTLTITNNLPASITDVEIADSTLPKGLNGKPVVGKLDKPVASGETYTVSYEITAENKGSYTLGAAAITYADTTGNYQKISSGTVSIAVI